MITGGPAPILDVALPLETVLIADIILDNASMVGGVLADGILVDIALVDGVLVGEGPVDGVLVVAAAAPLVVKTVKEESLSKPAVTTRVDQRLYGESNGVVYSSAVPRKVPMYVHVPVVELMTLHSKVWFAEGSPIFVRAAVDGPSTIMLV